MAYENLQAIVGRAMVDSAFRHSLLSKSPELLRELDLSSDESQIVVGITATTIQGFASELDDWISEVSASTLERVSV